MDINKAELWQYLAMGGGCVLVLGLIVYFVGGGKARLPGAIVSGFGGAVGGFALGLLFMVGFGYVIDKEKIEMANTPPPQMGPGGGGGMPKGGGMPGGGMPKGGGMPGGGMPGGGFGGPPGGGNRGPNSKTQLAALVTSLDKIADKSITVTLSVDQRGVIAKQLEGLADASEVSDDDAKNRLEAILAAIEKDHRTALEAVGYRWPGAGGAPKGGGAPGGGKGGFGGPPKEVPNPFKEGPPADALKSLSERVGKK